MFKNGKSLLIITFLLCISLTSTSRTKPNKADVLSIIEKVNNYWQKNNPPSFDPFWHEAAYHTGNMEAYFTTGNKNFLLYSETWSKNNKWMGATCNDKSKWKYSYGEKPEFVLFGDYQICFQTYIDLYNIAPDSIKIKRAIEVMEYQMSTSQVDYWWWVDGLYMVMPVMTKLYKLTGNELYLDKMYEYYMYAKSIMFDEETKLFYRDAKYVYPKHKTSNGKKDFWARGDGWLFAGLAKVLTDLPKSSKYHKTFEKQFKDMAKTLVKHQQAEGYWTRSIIDPNHAPGRETSGTAFFTYGLMWGVNNGYLSKAKYLKPALLGWDYLSKIALQPSGKVGYIQPIGERAIPGQVVNEQSTANFGVGAYLLAACEVSKLK